MTLQECNFWCQAEIYFAPLWSTEGVLLTLLFIGIYLMVWYAIEDYNKREKNNEAK